MLAYLFWHRPLAGIELEPYEDSLRAFHASLGVESASFRLRELPFGSGKSGYEDWYLVDGWAELGKLNGSAVDPLRLGDHDRAASMSADGWSAVYSLLRGPASIPDQVSWLDKPRGEASEEFLASLPRSAVWRRQMVLGQGPELCLASPDRPDSARRRIWPIP